VDYVAYTLLKRKIGASFLALLNDMDVLRLERADFKYARAVQYFNGPTNKSDIKHRTLRTCRWTISLKNAPGVCCLVSSSKRDAFDISPPSGAFSILLISNYSVSREAMLSRKFQIPIKHSPVQGIFCSIWLWAWCRSPTSFLNKSVCLWNNTTCPTFTEPKMVSKSNPKRHSLLF